MNGNHYKAQIKTYSANIERYNRKAIPEIRRGDYEQALQSYASIEENIKHIRNCIEKMNKADKPAEEPQEAPEWLVEQV